MSQLCEANLAVRHIAETACPSKKMQPDLETVIGFSDGGTFSAGVGPSAAAEKQVFHPSIRRNLPDDPEPRRLVM